MRWLRAQLIARQMIIMTAAASLLLAMVRWPQGSLLLGPGLLALDDSPETQAWGLGLGLLLAACMLRGIVRPNPGSIVLGVFAALAWLYLGVLGLAIGC